MCQNTDDTLSLERSIADALAKIPLGTVVMDAGRKFEDIWPLQDERFLKEGACHALAIELHAKFLAAKRKPEFFYLPNQDHPGIAAHVLVKCDGGFYDVHFGPQSEEEVIDRWKAKTASRLIPVGNPGWISVPKSERSSDSFLALDVRPENFERARERARAFIQRYRKEFGLPLD